jgi:hypothetical protein
LELTLLRHFNLGKTCDETIVVLGQDAQSDPVSQNVQIRKTQIIARAMNH